MTQLLVAIDGTWSTDRLGLAGDSNIGRGADLFRGRMLAVPGVGTGRLFDRLIGGLTGWRARRRLDQVLEVLERDYQPLGIEWLGIEGYSRGAAMALELTHELLDVGVDVDWLGLYDPVHSMGAPWNGRNGAWRCWVPLNVVRWGAVYAAHERRRTFRPTLLDRRQVDPRGWWQWLPGHHADVGGQGAGAHPICSRLALHVITRQRAEAGGDTAVAALPAVPERIRWLEPPLRLLPAYRRELVPEAAVHPWVQLVEAA